MHKDLKRFIEIAGLALEKEDRQFRSDIKANQTGYPQQKGGILRIQNERYYQFIIVRALTSSYPYDAKVELNSHDLVLRHPDPPHYWFTVVEMKKWMTPQGQEEIPGIVDDINTLHSVSADHALLLIISVNPRGDIKINLPDLTDKINNHPSSAKIKLNYKYWEKHLFATENKKGDKVEFWVAGYEVK